MVVTASARWRVILAAVGVVVGVAALPAGAAARASARLVQASSTNAQCPWVDSNKPIAERVSELIGQMTVAQEVIGQEELGKGAAVNLGPTVNTTATHGGGGPSRRSPRTRS